MYDGQTIRGVISYGSKNVKTGNLDTLWILRNDTPPQRAIKQGKDKSVCGNCPHRQGKGKLKDCYVQAFQAPQQVWRASKGKRVAKLPVNISRTLRLGGYGDPAMIPREVLEPIIKQYDKVLGYTYQWQAYWARWLREYCMASVKTNAQRFNAGERPIKWRTFRVSYDGHIGPGEILCPSPSVTCERCMLCSGNQSNGKDIVIVAHGTRSTKHLEV